MTSAFRACIALGFRTKSIRCVAACTGVPAAAEARARTARLAPGGIGVRRRRRQLVEERSRPRARTNKPVSRPVRCDCCRSQDFSQPLLSLPRRKCRRNEEASTVKKRSRAATGHRRRFALVVSQRKYEERDAFLGKAARSATLAGHHVPAVSARTIVKERDEELMVFPT